MESLTQIPLINDLIILAKPALYNVYFAAISIPFGFPLAILLAVGKASANKWVSLPSRAYIYAFRGSPLFIQFFMFYSLALAFNLSHWKPWGIDHIVLHPLFLGPLVLILNTCAYAAEIFHGALKAVPQGEIEAARAVGMNSWQQFRTVKWPHMIRLAWPAYTNEVVFLFHATALVYFTLPVIDEQKDLMNKAGELFEKDYNIFLHFSAAAIYFLLMSICVFYLFSLVHKRLTRHLVRENSPKMRFKPQYMR